MEITRLLVLALFITSTLARDQVTTQVEPGHGGKASTPVTFNLAKNYIFETPALGDGATYPQLYLLHNEAAPWYSQKMRIGYGYLWNPVWPKDVIVSNLDLNTSHGGNAVVAQDIISDRVETMELKVHWSSFPNDVLKNRKSAEAEIYFNCKLVASFNSEDHPKGGVVYRDTVLVSTRVGINTLDFVGLGEVDGMGVLFTYVVVRGPREMINSPVAKPNLIQQQAKVAASSTTTNANVVTPTTSTGPSNSLSPASIQKIKNLLSSTVTVTSSPPS